jgi:hypothetical protein
MAHHVLDKHLTDEMALLLAVCRPSPNRARVANLAARAIDAQALLRLADRHRVSALAHRGFQLAGIKPPAGSEIVLAEAAHHTVRQALRLAAETARIVAALEGGGVPTVAIKGASLAILAHGTLATKYARDIDLLVSPDQLDEAAAVMAAAGYERSGDGRDVPLAAWHRFAKDSAWRHPRRRVTVELHTALTDFPCYLLPRLCTDSALQPVTVSSGHTVRTFASEPLFAYLCVHGALSGWRRLKWLADLAGLMRAMDTGEVARLHVAAVALGAGRAATQAVMLSAQLLATPLPPHVETAMKEDRWSRWLVTRAARLLTDPNGFDDPGERALGTLPIHLMTLQLAPAPGYRCAVLRRYLRADPRGRRLPFPLVRLAERLRR